LTWRLLLRWRFAVAGSLVVFALLAAGCGGDRGLGKTASPTNDDPFGLEGQPQPKLVVFYVLDALRADHVGGRGWTPVIDGLAAGGVSFSDYTSTAASTMTYAKTLFSGRFFLEKGGLPAGLETLAEVIRTAGFQTVGISGNGHVSPKYGLARGFDIFEMVYPLARGADPLTYVNRNAADIHRRALEILDDEATGRPIFLYLHTVHPHTPYAPPHELVGELCGGIPSTIDGMSPTLLAVRDGGIETSDADRQRLACLYAAGLRYNDEELGVLLDEIGRRYPAEDVLFIVTSDHGEEFFDHGGVLHGHTLYDELLRVPLVFHWPGRLPPVATDAACDTIDLHETLRALVGAPPSSADTSGRSLWPVVISSDAGLLEPKLRFATVPTLPGGMTMVRSESHKMVLAPRTDGGPGMGLGLGRSHDSEYLFDLNSDPGETRNLIGGGAPQEEWLRTRLTKWIELTSRQGGSVAVELDEATRQHLEALGYVE
jgi:arylsulfatase A-like enzyme